VRSVVKDAAVEPPASPLEYIEREYRLAAVDTNVTERFRCPAGKRLSLKKYRSTHCVRTINAEVISLLIRRMGGKAAGPRSQTIAPKELVIRERTGPAPAL
jgi:hypothetical protein